MQRLTNLNCSLTHWNSIQSSSELLISQQNLLPNLPFLEHLSRHRHRLPLSLQQYLEKINIALFFLCFSLSPYTTEKLLSTRKQPTFPPSDQKRNNLPQKFTNQTALLPHILLDFKTRCICTGAAGTMNKAQEDVTCWYIQLTIPLWITCSQRTKSQPSASSYQCSQRQTLPVNTTFPSQRYRVRGSLGLCGLRHIFQSSLSVAHPSAILPSTHPPRQPLTSPCCYSPFLLNEVHTLLLPPVWKPKSRSLGWMDSLLAALTRGSDNFSLAVPVAGASVGLAASACVCPWLPAVGAERGGMHPACRSRSRGSPPANPPLSAGWAGQGDGKMCRLLFRFGTPSKAGGGRRAERLGEAGSTGEKLHGKLCQTKEKTNPHVLVFPLWYESSLLGGKTKPNQTQKYFNWSPCKNCSRLLPVSAAESPCPVNSSDTSWF